MLNLNGFHVILLFKYELSTRDEPNTDGIIPTLNDTFLLLFILIIDLNNDIIHGNLLRTFFIVYILRGTNNRHFT